MSTSKRAESPAQSQSSQPGPERFTEDAAKSQTAKKSMGWGTIALRVLAILVVIGISVLVFMIRDRVDQFAVFGYPGIFLVALLTNATVFLPAPGIAVVFAMGSVFHPLGVALAAGTGGALGELTGYLAGFGGRAAVERTDTYAKIQPWVAKYGGWAILALSAIPNPFFDLAGFAAGAGKMPVLRFLLFCWFGQLIKMTMMAYAGSFSLNWLLGLFK